MYLSIIILPLLGSIVAGFFGRKVGVRGAQIITCSCVIVTTILALLAWVEVAFNNIPVTINLFRWIDSEWFNITWGFYFDALTVTMLIPVLIISSLVHIYSIGYMSNDPHQQRFFSYLSLFTFMMIILVTGNNYLLMFVGWEGVGVCSYLLVSFWFTRIAANQRKRLIWVNYLNRHPVGGIITNNLIFKRSFSQYSNKLKSFKYPSNSCIMSLIVGSLLSISYLERREYNSSNSSSNLETANTRIIFLKYGNNVEYLMWFHSVFARAGYCNHIKPKLYKLIGKGNTVLFFCKFKSYSFSSLNLLFDLFYPLQSISCPGLGCVADNRIKVIPVNLYKYITPLTLATLFLSSVWEEKSILVGQAILNPSYPDDLVVKGLKSVSDVLEKKFNIETDIKINRGLSLGSLSIKNPSVFASVIKPYLLSSQVYLLKRSNLSLNFLGRNQFKRFLSMSSIRYLSTANSLGNYKDEVREKSFINAAESSSSGKFTIDNYKNLDFLEWFRGFTDAEGSFGIKKESNSSFSFSFQIGLHMDDINVLNFLQKNLGIGKINYYRNSVRWVVKNQDEILVILDIFSKYPLNTSKHLNFLAFKEAFEMYISRGTWIVPSNLVERIVELKNSMNTLRTIFEKDSSHQIRVTPNWFLGFIEGEGSFNVVRDGLGLRFSITQSSIDLEVLEAIKEFLIKLSGRDNHSFSPQDCTFVGIDLAKTNKSQQRDWCILRTSSNWFIGSALIPFFDSLVFRSKKEKDYLDWKTIFYLKEKGHHHTDVGLKLIELILSQMNNRRLSSEMNRSIVDREHLYTEIHSLLSGPSNYQITDKGTLILSKQIYLREGGVAKAIQIIDEEGEVLEIFPSMLKCAEVLGKNNNTLTKWVRSNRQFKWKNKLCTIKKL